MGEGFGVGGTGPGGSIGGSTGGSGSGCEGRGLGSGPGVGGLGSGVVGPPGTGGPGVSRVGVGFGFIRSAYPSSPLPLIAGLSLGEPKRPASASVRAIFASIQSSIFCQWP